MKTSEFLQGIAKMNKTPFKEGLLKEVGSWLIEDKAVLVETSELDLDTDGGNDPNIKWDKTHQSATSLKWPKGSNVDSNATRFVVIPIGWGERHGIKLGDVGLACIKGCDAVYGVIVADKGPTTKIGEASIALHRAFGHETVVNGRIRDVGMDGPFHMLLFKGTSNGHCRNNDDSQTLAMNKWFDLIA